MAVELTTDKDFREKLSDHNKVVVKYSADWCGSCRLLAPKYESLSKDKKYDDIAFLDINSDHNPESRELAKLTTLPYFAIFKDGELVEGVSANKEELVIDLINRLN